MEDQTLHHRLARARPVDRQTPSLLERLSSQERTETLITPPLQEKLSNVLKPFSNRLGRTESRRHKPSLRLAKSLPRNHQEASNSSLRLSTDMSQPLTVSRPSLLSRMNVDSILPIPQWHSESERRFQEEQTK